jgi:K(+)-stimulated pyrophosphate-energized sodium pump
MFGFIIIAVVGALGFAAVNFILVRKKKTGTKLMGEIAVAIQEGASAFLANEYKVISWIAVIIAAALGLVVSWYTAVVFILGALMSSTAGLIGMKIATLSNVRVSNAARETKSLGKTLKVAFQGGSVMGLSVGGFAILGLGIVYLVFGHILGQAEPKNLTIVTNWIGIDFIPFEMTVTGYALGCSIIAMFFRVGGGIYTKAADMGADLVGKTEAGIPEDDPRNPATIADNVGDNVGDVAGLGSDLLESYIGSLIASVVLSTYMFYTSLSTPDPMPGEVVTKMIHFPITFAAIGIIASIIGIFFLVVKREGDKPHRELNTSVWSTAGLTLIGGGVLTYFTFRGMDLSATGFNAGVMSPWIAAILGIASGIVIGQLAEYYTSYDFKPTQHISQASKEGAALTITQGMAVGMKSVFFPVVVLAVAIIGSNAVAGLYGVAMAALGMLSFVVATVAVDTYGPIADNAGGISEMAGLESEVRGITDKLDSVGNTTAAIGKGFAIGSAALAALSLFASYLYSQAEPGQSASLSLVLNMIDTLTLAGALVGGALPFLFSGILIEAVAKAARKMVQEVRRQFDANPRILSGDDKPDYKQCIEISSAGSIAEMKFPALIAVITPLASGFIFGPKFVGGLLIGTTLAGIMLALYNANAGGAWDNAKKYIENGMYGGKGSNSHSSAVVGDTVGDPLKDTVGPSLDILIKIMAVISLITVSIFSKYNLVGVLFG